MNFDAPKLGDGVVIGFGANAVITKDVLEENIAVAGVPAKKSK